MSCYATLPVSCEKVTLQILENPVSAKKTTLTVSVAEKKKEQTKLCSGEKTKQCSGEHTRPSSAAVNRQSSVVVGGYTPLSDSVNQGSTGLVVSVTMIDH